MDNCGNRNKCSVRKNTYVIVGVINNEEYRFVNLVTSKIKHYIYRIKVQKQKLNIIAIKYILHKQFQIENYILF